MKTAVMGAGAVGCYYGGMLARAGHEVILIGRQQHVEAARRDGLFLDTKVFQAHVPVQADTAVSAMQGAKLVLCCVKSTDTESAATDMAPYLEPDAVVLSLQNGVDNAERLQAALGHEVIPTVVYVATEMAGPGHVKHHGRGELVIGPSAASDRLVRSIWPPPSPWCAKALPSPCWSKPPRSARSARASKLAPTGFMRLTLWVSVTKPVAGPFTPTSW